MDPGGVLECQPALIHPPISVPEFGDNVLSCGYRIYTVSVGRGKRPPLICVKEKEKRKRPPGQGREWMNPTLIAACPALCVRGRQLS